MRRIAYTLILALSMVGCSGDRSIKITDQNKDSVLDQIKNSKSFTPEEIGLIISRQMRVSMAASFKQPAPEWIGQTLQQVIDSERKVQQDAKAKQAETDRLAAEAKAKEDALAAELRKAISLTVYDKGFVPSNPSESRYEDYITIKCAYENLSGKDIRAFAGAVKLTDLFGKEIFTTTLTISDPINAAAKATWSGTIKYNQFLANHQALRNAELKDMKVVWLPTSVLFADGTQIGEK